MHELRSEVVIDAPVERVWQVLTDFDAFPDWNPFIRQIRGKPEVGTRLEVVIGASGTRRMRFRPRVLTAIPNREFRRLGRLGVSGLFDGEHIFELEPLGSVGTRFVQRERFRGLLVPLLARSLRDARRGFEEMNHALRTRVPGSPYEHHGTRK